MNACGIHLIEHVETLGNAWFLHQIVQFAGQDYEYLVEVWRGESSLAEIEARMRAFAVRARLFERFLKDVRLETVQ